MKGILIAGMGLPGAGKSSVLGALADLVIRNGASASIYREPEEPEWPDAVRCRNESGFITALTWFRAIRVPMLYRAASDRKAGKVAIVDSYYDKLIHLYLDDPLFNWLIPADDPYRVIYKQMVKQDFESLPDADCVVTFVVSQERWCQLVRGRGRELDRKSNILDLYAMQPKLLSAAESYCHGRGIPHVSFENSKSPLADAAKALLEDLGNVNIELNPS